LRTPIKAVAEAFDLAPVEIDRALEHQLRFNIAPTQPVAAIRRHAEQNRRELVWLVWGLIPAWVDCSTSHRSCHVFCQRRGRSAANGLDRLICLV
jgi:putative SOS response-associated peptidase YedK